MTFLEEDEMVIKNMLMELNNSCEHYGMNININKTKAMVIGRKPKKINCELKINRSNKWTASNTLSAISVAT